MIITAKPYSTFTTQSFELEGEGFSRYAMLGGIDPREPITMFAKDETVIVGEFEESGFLNYIPYRYLFGKENITRVFRLYKKDERYGVICFSEHGYLR